MEKVTFFVRGTPRPKGSLKWIPSKSTGRMIPVPMSKYLPAWVKAVAQEGALALRGCRTYGGCSMTLVFNFERPKAHYRTGRYSHLLRDDAPDRHLQDPDGDKLERAILDGLTGIAYHDDNEVDTCGRHKRWAGRGSGEEGVQITLRGVFHGV